MVERRDVVKMLLVGGTVAFAALAEHNTGIAFASEPAPAQLPRPVAPAQALTPVDAIKNTIAFHENRPLSVAAAKEVTDRTVAWAGNRGDLSIDPTLLKGVYFLTAVRNPEIIVRSNYDPKQSPFDHPIVEIFYDNHPDYPRSEEKAKELLSIYHNPRAPLAGTFAGSIFLVNLDYINNPSGFLGGPGNGHSYLYQGPGPKPARIPVTPVGALVSVDNHEVGHLDPTGLPIPLDPELVEYYRRNSRDTSGQTTFSGWQRHFIVTTIATREGPGVTGPPEEEFNEFVIDHFNIGFLEKAGIPWMPGYGREPFEHSNFALVLRQSEVTLANFRAIQTSHDPKKALVALAMGAQGEHGRLFSNSTSIQDMLDFAMPRFPFGDFPDWNPSPNNPFRGEMQRFYPGIALAQPPY